MPVCTEFKNILVVIQTAEEARTILPKVHRLGLMINPYGATDIDRTATPSPNIHVIRVAWEGFADLAIEDVEASTGLKNFILQSEEQALKDAIATCGVRIDNLECATVWGRKQWEVTLELAKHVKADLIVKPASQPEKLRKVRTPDDWNLLRHADIPVLLCDGEPWSATPTLVAAVDVFDEDHAMLNVRILRTTQRFASGLHANAHIVTAFPCLGPWSTRMNTFRTHQQLMQNVEQDANRRLSTLQAEQGLDRHTGWAVEGPVKDVIQRTVDDVAADILLVGTTARDGIGALVLGNTAEEILESTQVDILTVP